MRASIIISVSSNKQLFDNFLVHLSNYKTINNYEIIFVNDNVDFALEQGYLAPYSFTNAKVIDSKEKMGYGAANNLAVDFSSCKFLIFMNDDVILKDNCLELLIDDLECHRADAVQPKLIYPQNNTIQSTGHVFTKYSNAHAFENLPMSSQAANITINRTALTTAICATRRDLFLLMGKFDSIYCNAWEGMEYTLKLTLKGYKCLYNHKAEAYHIRGGARGLYSLDEDSQSAIFWSRWSDKITPDLPQLILSQFKNNELNHQYLFLNFSKLTNVDWFIKACRLNVDETISYTYNSGLKTIDFFKCLPTRLCQTEMNIIYFSNNFTQVKNNTLWYELREKHHDLIIDLSGNVINIANSLPNSSF